MTTKNLYSNYSGISTYVDNFPFSIITKRSRTFRLMFRPSPHLPSDPYFPQLFFTIHLSILCRRHFLTLAPLRLIWRLLSLAFFCSCPFRLGLPFFLFLGVPCRLRYVTVQRCGSGLRRASSSTHVLARGIGVSMVFPKFCIYMRLIRVG